MDNCPTCGGPVVFVEPRHDGDTGYVYSTASERVAELEEELRWAHAALGTRWREALNIPSPDDD